MATLKHIASKNSDYSAVEAYLIYQHDEFTGKQLLDEQGRPMLRESYILDTLECGDYSFATACLLANRRYGKNTQHGDIKSHQYIISFDPRDAADNGLTMEKAQALGLQFCKDNFPVHTDRGSAYCSMAFKKDLHDPDNHDDVITNLEPDILECEVKWALESITTNKASGGDGIPQNRKY